MHQTKEYGKAPFLVKESACKCLHCGATFKGNSNYCSVECCRNYQRTVKESWRTLLSPGSIGAVGELRVAIDLLTHGYEVFRSLSPNSSADLISLKDGQLLTIEVRMGELSKSTKKIVVKRSHRADVLAIALPDGRIVYEPPLE